jgi:hypothetical protein
MDWYCLGLQYDDCGRAERKLVAELFRGRGVTRLLLGWFGLGNRWLDVEQGPKQL